MAHVIGLKIETVDEKRRDALLEAISDLLADQMDGADATTITLTREAKTARGKRKVVDTVTFVAGGPIPDLSDFGLTSMTPMEQAIERLRPKVGDGVDYVELSAAGKSVRLGPRS